MDAYVPPKASPVKKALTNPLVHFAILAVIIMGSILFIREQRKHELQNRISYLRGNENQASSSTGPEAGDGNSPSAATTPPPPASVAALNAERGTLNADNTSNVAASANSINPNNVNPPAGPEQTNGEALGARPAVTESPFTKIVAYYTIVPTVLVQRFVEESQSLGSMSSFGEYTYGPVRQIEQKLKANDGGVRVELMQKFEKRLDPSKPTQEWFMGSSDPESGQSIGLTTIITLAENTAQALKGEVEVVRIIKESSEPGAQAQRRSFPANLELSKDTGLMMIGLLPRRIPTTAEVDLFNNSILRVMNSPRFQNHENEFVIFYTAEK
jgi:hypothetical protein